MSTMVTGEATVVCTALLCPLSTMKALYEFVRGADRVVSF